MIKEIEEIQSELNQKPALRELMKEAVGCTREELHLLTNEMLKTNEIWKDIEGYEGKYQISNIGRVKSVERFDMIGRRIREKIMKCQTNEDGYLNVTLGFKENKKTFLVHRLVAIHFLPNPMNLPEVNHKDVTVTNNRVDNLEWCDRTYNVNYDSANLKVAEKLKKAVVQIDKKGKIIRRWNSISEAARTLGIHDTRIVAVCKNKKYRHTAGGFKWQYAEESK